MTQNEIALLISFIALAGSLIGNCVQIFLHHGNTKASALDTKRKAAIAFHSVIQKCLDDIHLGGDGRVANIPNDAYSAFLLSLPSGKRR